MLVTLGTAAAVTAACTLTRWFLERTSLRPVNFCGGRVRVQGHYNRGAAFGNRLLKGKNLIALSGAALGLTLAEFRRDRLGAGLVLGGGVSNLLERIRRGKVFDYIRFPKAPGRWRRYVFDLADFAIFLGAVLMLVRGKKK